MTIRHRVREGAGLAAWACLSAAAAAGAPATASAPASAPAAVEPTPLARWARVADVRLDGPPAQGVAELSLPPEVFAAARTDLGDLRLATRAGAFVPYVLRVDRGRKGQPISYAPTRMFNPVFLPGRESSVTVDFGGNAPRTDVDVQTPGTNFRRRVTVEAGPDGQSWQVLRKTDWLFRVSYEGGTFSKARVALPDNDFRYLRVTVFNAPDDPEKVAIASVRAWSIKDTPPQTVGVPVISAVAAEKPKLKTTEIEADLGFEKLPLYEIALAFSEANFLRRVEVLGRDRRTEIITERVEDAPPRRREVEVPWTALAGGTVHRFSSPQGQAESQGLTLRLEGGRRYVLVRIHNGDNAPLTFTGLTARRLQTYLAFQPAGVGSCRLYVGNPAADGPQYDLAHFIDRLRAQGVTKAALGPVGPNPLFAVETKPVPWSERYRSLLWVALLAVLGVLTVLVIRQARRIPRNAA